MSIIQTLRTKNN